MLCFQEKGLKGNGVESKEKRIWLNEGKDTKVVI